jgi:hypothetical protein
MVALITHPRATHKILTHTMAKGPDELGQTSSPQRHPLLPVTLAPVVPSIRVPRGNPAWYVRRARFGAPRVFLPLSFRAIPLPSHLVRALELVPLNSLDSAGAGDILGASGEAA